MWLYKNVSHLSTATELGLVGTELLGLVGTKFQGVESKYLLKTPDLSWLAH